MPWKYQLNLLNVWEVIAKIDFEFYRDRCTFTQFMYRIQFLIIDYWMIKNWNTKYLWIKTYWTNRSSRGLTDNPGDGGDDLTLLPEEVDKLVVWMTSLYKNVLGIMWKGNWNNILTFKFCTSQWFQFSSLF